MSAWSRAQPDRQSALWPQINLSFSLNPLITGNRLRHWNTKILHSPSDLIHFLGCAHSTALDLRKLIAPSTLPDKAEDDEFAKLVQKAGIAHENAYLQQCFAQGNVVVIPGDGELAQRAAATREAMKAGAKTIYQGVFLQPPWHGIADFLQRVDVPSALGAWSYEPADTKLARSVKASHIVQLGLYADYLAAEQGEAPGRIHVALGDGSTESFNPNDFHYTLAAAKARYLTFVTNGATSSRPEPCASCKLCGFRDHCTRQWKAEDHLSRVLGLGKPQIKKLRRAGIETVEALAHTTPATVVQGMTKTLPKLRRQAQLQRSRWAGGQAVVETLPLQAGRGFALLPPPDSGDVFFDLEGDPLTDGGLDYLWGLHYRDSGHPVFRYRWAHTPADERTVFEQTVDFLIARLTAHPGAHVYHYAPYEATSLKRLSTRHGSREAEVDRLLRERRLVDLYTVLRQAIRTSEDDLSLKTMEVFFAPARTQAVTSAGQSIVQYDAWCQTKDPSILDGILDYNMADCENLETCRNWLITLNHQGPQPPVPYRAVGEIAGDAEEQTEEAARIQALAAAIRAGTTPPSQRGRELMVHLIEFHRRADKPAYWAMFDRTEREPTDLIEDGECIGDIEPDIGANGCWQRSEKRSVVAAYRFEPQDTKLKGGDAVLHAPTLQPLGTIVALDAEAGTVSLKRGAQKGPFPDSGSLIPVPTVGNKALIQAVRRVATAWSGGNGADQYPALVDILERSAPRFVESIDGPLVGLGDDPVRATIKCCLALNDSYLVIQGPPGTGKTHVAAHTIVALLAQGKTVGVSSNSHKVINNLLSRVEEVALQLDVQFAGVRKTSGPETRLSGSLVRDVDTNDLVVAAQAQLIGGTAWVFADRRLNRYLDYLFIDEAGQVALGNVIAMGGAARNVVLVGDQMQLGQPIQGAHPADSGLSVLDYLLRGAATVPPDRGILLNTSWRMHPTICSFISDAVYEGRLNPHADCARQKLHLDQMAPPVLLPHGIRWVPMSHSGCGQRSDEEVAAVKDLASALMGTPFTDRHGQPGRICWENILIVAPYNMQVNALIAALPPDARVGTVDKFQGQEAEVVIISMTSSSPDDLPRHIDFFYSKNRLNVAISRARTAAFLLANPKLLELNASSVEHLQMVNTLAWALARN